MVETGTPQEVTDSWAIRLTIELPTHFATVCLLIKDISKNHPPFCLGGGAYFDTHTHTIHLVHPFPTKITLRGGVMPNGQFSPRLRLFRRRVGGAMRPSVFQRPSGRIIGSMATAAAQTCRASWCWTAAGPRSSAPALAESAGPEISGARLGRRSAEPRFLGLGSGSGTHEKEGEATREKGHHKGHHEHLAGPYTQNKTCETEKGPPQFKPLKGPVSQISWTATCVSHASRGFSPLL